jgi:uncharacterized membrane protein
MQANREQRALQKQYTKLVAKSEKFQRKLKAVEQKRDKPTELLKEMYASGKIDSKKYSSLLKRDKDVTIDLVVFGKNAGIKLAARYISGQVDKEQFETLKNEILGSPEAEKDLIIQAIEEQTECATDFLHKAQEFKSATQCNYCGKPKKFFSPLRSSFDVMLCASCSKTFSSLISFAGYEGQYYIADPAEIIVDGKTSLTINIKEEYILDF